jgi:hypothetical protein
LDASFKEAQEYLGEGAGGDMDETSCPPDITVALGVAAFSPRPVLASGPPPPPCECGVPPPRDLDKYVRAAESGCVARGLVHDADVATARGEVLREVLACGWLSREFVTAQRQGQRPHTSGNTSGNSAVCAPETSRWLFAVVTDPASTREVVVGARDALFAAAGFEVRRGRGRGTPVYIMRVIDHGTQKKLNPKP